MKNQETKAIPLTDVQYYFDGGNIYLYRAKLGECWLIGELDDALLCYDRDPIEEYETAQEVEPPRPITWREIIASVLNTANMELVSIAVDAIKREYPNRPATIKCLDDSPIVRWS